MISASPQEIAAPISRRRSQTSAAHASQLSMCQHPAPTKVARSLR